MAWTLLVVIACLINGSAIPSVPSFDLPNKDKIAHFVFYFVFSILWFLYLKHPKVKTGIAVFVVFAMATVVGMLVELLQFYFTDTRNAEWADVAANCCGSLFGLAIVNLLLSLKK